MEEQFVPYDIALKLKELGFNESCLAYYNKKELFSFTQICNEPLKGHYIKMSNRLCTPLYQQVFEHFRNNNNMHHDIVHQESSSQEWYDAYVEGEKIDECGSYRQAQIACINKLIKLAHDK